MKKALLSTTALIAGGLIAGSVMAADLEPAPLPAPVDEGFTVEVGGQVYAGFYYLSSPSVSTTTTVLTTPTPPAIVSTTTTTRTKLKSQSVVPYSGEIWFTATTTLANGIQVGVRVELEGSSVNNDISNGGGDDQIDEHYIWVSGNFGKFIIGAEDGASDLLAVLAPSAGALGLNGPTFVAVAAMGVADGAHKDFSSDANKLTYLTPRISGFQAGFSFTPNNQFGGGARLAVQEGGSFRNIMSAAANYSNTFNNVSVMFGAGMETAKSSSVAAVSGRRTDWNVGGRLGMSGFTIGGNYSRSKNKALAAPTKSRSWQVGATYGTGPWTVGAGYLASKAITSGRKYTRIGGGVTYALGTGVTLIGDVNFEKQSNSGVALNDKGTIAGVGILAAF